jgi:C-terminal processing protease CtpA/Prc
LKAALQEVSLPDLSGADASLRYGAVIIHWNVLQHFYPYFDVVETDWDAALTGALRRAAADASSEDFLATLRWMIAQSKDGHGSVRHPLLQKKGTPPISVAQTDSAIAVSALADSLDGEAVQSGNLCAEPGDAVVAVDGTPVEAYVDSLKSYISGSPQWKTYRALADFGIGDAGTPVRLVLRRDGAQKTCTLQRRSDLHVRPDRPSPVTELQPGIFYVDATRAGKDVIDRHIDTLAAAEGVIFDFRGYPERNHDLLTHLSPDTLRSARWLVPQVIYPDRKKPVGYDRPGRWRLPPQQPQISGDVAVLTSARAISYSESVLGIVEHYELGTIVGQPTAGANGNANPYTLPGDYRVNWTGMRVLKHDGSQHHLVGVRPDVLVIPTRSDLRAGRDASLQRALEIIAE